MHMRVAVCPRVRAHLSVATEFFSDVLGGYAGVEDAQHKQADVVRPDLDDPPDWQ